MGRTCSTYGNDENFTQILVGNIEGKRHLEDLGVDGRILKLILEKHGEGFWTRCIWLKLWTSGGLL